MKFTVHATARVEADSPGAAEEIAEHEHVDWIVRHGSWLRNNTKKATGAFAVAWMATAPWADGGLGLIGEHVARALTPVTALIGLLAA